ncbi:phosphatase [Wenjunlia tyrosinilytica]|nr:phosphatase [Wenjunlia tyrosinilytica]
MAKSKVRNATPARDELVAHLVRSRIAGDVATPRDNNLAHYRELAEGNRHFWLGLELGDRWTDERAVLEVMAQRCGVVADPNHVSGQDTINAELTVDALERVAVRLRKAIAGEQRVLFATGHPAGMLPVHQAVARSLRLVGCRLVTPAEGLYADNGDVRLIGGVSALHRGGNLLHTHSPDPMTAILDALERDDLPMPDLVFADHGWAGCAAQRGIDTIGFADCNDPALFVGEAEGTIAVTVPLDDNVPPHLYDPMTEYLLEMAGLFDD